MQVNRNPVICFLSVCEGINEHLDSVYIWTSFCNNDVWKDHATYNPDNINYKIAVILQMMVINNVSGHSYCDSNFHLKEDLRRMNAHIEHILISGLHLWRMNEIIWEETLSDIFFYPCQ